MSLAKSNSKLKSAQSSPVLQRRARGHLWPCTYLAYLGMLSVQPWSLVAVNSGKAMGVHDHIFNPCKPSRSPAVSCIKINKVSWSELPAYQHSRDVERLYKIP